MNEGKICIFLLYSFVSLEIKDKKLLSYICFMGGRRGSRPLSVFPSLIIWIAAHFAWLLKKGSS